MYYTSTELNQHSSIMSKLAHLHATTQAKLPQITRIAVALFDETTDIVRTFIYSGKPSPLNHYQANLSRCHSLLEIARFREARIVQDLGIYRDSRHEHAIKIYEAGYRSSYTLPLLSGNTLLGFIFFNGDDKEVLDKRCVEHLDLIGNLLALMVINELSEVNTLASTMKTAIDVTHFRDPETAGHLSRMAHYSRLIAQRLADERGLNDHFIEHIFMFAPLHDIGKITVPDEILFKRGPLTLDERAEMQKHCESGRDLIDKLLCNYRLSNLDHTQMLRNIVLYHHEAIDGSGYPTSLRGDEVPIEARIVAVADVFDALTSERPYKSAWTNSDAFAELERLSGSKLDADCVAALHEALPEVLRIQSTFDSTEF
ncbi:HD domain-containing phosphohydrolase [Shewanella aquimarina]|uniref:HD domain-containing phosphohydrolase n=1 Tax=Shewanella aquimarina TaxID=260365 RepID=UPI002014F3BC|nr:HD-GYP domain-containing protein [Shewanella aquimarina]MCL2908775.1 HD-GYP domain-containing protein [Shewanella aquimarina]